MLSLAKPDFDRLQAISEEADRLREAGEWNRAAFRRLLDRAHAASNGHGEFTEFLFLYAEPSWLARSHTK